MNLTKLRYHGFFKNNPETTRRTIDRLRELKLWMARPEADGGGGVPPKDTDATLLLATWNIRDFGKNKGYGDRTLEPLHYMAQIISGFDLVALQEITDDLSLFKDLMDILGRNWEFIATDVTGNQERMVFVYDTRKVHFRSIVGEITLLEDELIRTRQSVPLPADAILRKKDGTIIALPDDVELELPEGAKELNGKQFNRTPFMVSFQAGWFKFNLCTVHMYYGSGKEGLERRRQEIEKVAQVFQKRAEKERRKAKEAAEARHETLDESALETYFVLGDFNILKPSQRTGESETLNALLDNGFGMHPKLREAPTNMFQTEYYDQIAVLEDHGHVKMDEAKAGALDFFQVVYRASEEDVAIRNMDADEDFPAAVESDFLAYFDQMGETDLRDTHDRKRTFKDNVKVVAGDPRTPAQQREWYATNWRTYHMSDHIPLWMALKIDFSEDYLDRIEDKLSPN
ncbi:MULTISPECIES: endonuclease/exonuclease/phosphatase family protein [Hyphomonas]|jgi:hypothetical protein|uniref:endonuclease/exonuclease/phosphatase family protein n=1 Tax=Hyphomonas TaxID=85 RepID=UPI003512CDCF